MQKDDAIKALRLAGFHVWLNHHGEIKASHAKVKSMACAGRTRHISTRMVVTFTPIAGEFVEIDQAIEELRQLTAIPAR